MKSFRTVNELGWCWITFGLSILRNFLVNVNSHRQRCWLRYRLVLRHVELSGHDSGSGVALACDIWVKHKIACDIWVKHKICYFFYFNNFYSNIIYLFFIVLIKDFTKGDLYFKVKIFIEMISRKKNFFFLNFLIKFFFSQSQMFFFPIHQKKI